MPFPSFGGGGGARSEFVVSGSPFSGTNKAAAEAARDAWVNASQSNRNELYNQDSDPFRVAICVITYGTSTETQQWAGTDRPASSGAYDNNGWVANEGLDASEIQSLVTSGLTDGRVIMKSASGLADTGARVLSDNTLLLPEKTRAESASIEFGDITTVGEANSFLRIRNTQFPSVRFDLIDARERSTGASSAPRQFFLTEARNDFNIQTTQTTTITANPLTFTYTATLDSQTSQIKVKTGAAMSNVRVRIRYDTSPNAVVKFLPSEAAWIDEAGGYNWTSGDNTVDLTDTPFRTFTGDQYEVQIRADSVSMLGNSSNFPYLVTGTQRGEFRDLAFHSELSNANGAVITTVQYLDGDGTDDFGKMRFNDSSNNQVQSGSYSNIATILFNEEGGNGPPSQQATTAVDNRALFDGVEVGAIFQMTSTAESGDELNFQVTQVNAKSGEVYSFGVEELSHTGTLGGSGRDWVIKVKPKADLIDVGDIVALSGNSKYVGTNSIGTLGVFDLPQAQSMIDDTSIATNRVRSAQNVAQHTSSALTFHARNSQTYNMAAGEIVAVVGGDTWMNGNVEHLELIHEKGSAAQYLLPVGVLTEALNASTNKERVVLHKGHYNVTIPGQNDLPLDTPIYVTRTGSGNNEIWSFTHDGTGANTYFVGRIHNDAGTNTYWAWIDFGLVWAHHYDQSVDDTIKAEDNGTAVTGGPFNTLNFMGDHHMVGANSSDSSQLDIMIDPGTFMLRNGTGGVTEIGQGAQLGVTSGNEAAIDVDGAAQQFPTMWANGEIAADAVGEFVRSGIIRNTPRIDAGASLRHAAPITAGAALYYRVDGETFSTVVDTRFFIVGNVLSSKYRLDQTAHFDATLNSGSTGISNAAGANAARNATITVPSSMVSGTTFTIPNLQLNQEYTTPFQVGDQIVFTNTRAGITLNIAIQLNGLFQDINGNSISNYSLSNYSNVTIERIAGDIWKVVGVNKDAIVSDVVVEYDRLNNNHDALQDNRIFALEGDLEDQGGLNDKSTASLKSHFRGFDTYTTNNNTLTIKAGECGSDNGSEIISRNSDLSIALSGSTTDNGALEAASTWYYLWIYKATVGTGTIVRYSTSNSSPTVPGGYTAKRMIGAVYNNASSNFEGFWAQGAGASKKYLYKSEVLSISNQSISSRTAFTLTSRIPALPNSPNGYPLCTASIEYSGSANLLIYNAAEGNTYQFAAAGVGLISLPLLGLDSQGRFHLDSTGTNTGVYLKVIGFFMEL